MDVKYPVNNKVGSDALSSYTFSQKHLLTLDFVCTTAFGVYKEISDFPSLFSPLRLGPPYIPPALFLFYMGTFSLQSTGCSSGITSDAASIPILSSVIG